MTPETATEIVRKACGERPCQYCDHGSIQTATGFYANEIECPVCEGSNKSSITLADVLMALHANHKKIGSHYTVQHFNGNECWIQFANILPIEWSLTTDFHGQDESTKLAIAELLK